MKKNLLIGTGAAALMLVAGWAIMPGQDATEANYTPRTLASEAQGITGAIEYYDLLLANRNTGKVEPADLYNGRIQARKWARAHAPKAVNLAFTEMGPDNYGGRCRAILPLNVAPYNQVYAGSVAGGLYYSQSGGDVWERVTGYDGVGWNNISSLAQTGNGKIYVATGCRFEWLGAPSSAESSGRAGNGIYMTTDIGTNATFTQVANSAPTAISTSANKGFWNRLAADKIQADKLWAGGNAGLWTYTDADGFTEHTRNEIGVGPGNFSNVGDIQISTDGLTIIASDRGTQTKTWVSHDAGASWTDVSGNLPNLPSGGVSRVTYAISPDDKNWIYAAAVSGSGGSLHGIYHSMDGGLTWELIGPGGSSNFDPFTIQGVQSQGFYDNAITCVPGHKERIIVGGIVLWEWIQVSSNPSYGQWEPVDYSVHSDIHKFAWAPNGHLYVGTDGGVYKTVDGGEQFFPANRGFNVAQVYGMDYSSLDKAVGGTQDNGTFYINYEGLTYKEAEDIFGGDGFDCEFSSLNPEVIFATSQYGSLGRSDDDGGGWQMADGTGWYGGLINSMFDANGRLGPFYTNIALYDTPNDPLSEDSLLVVVNQNLNPGDTLIYNSSTLNMELMQTVTAQIDSGDTVLMPDPVQSWFAVGFGASEGVWITRDALRFGVSPGSWIKALDNTNGMTATSHVLEFSEDGDHLFVGTYDGKTYRISNLDQIYGDQAQFDSVATVTLINTNGGGIVTDISVDPNNPEHVVVVHSGFGGNHVYESNSAVSATGTGTFSSIDGNLPNNPSAPVYGCVIDRDDPNVIIIGTEYGVYATDDGGSTWTDQNNELGHVAVFDVEQQHRGWNDGVFNPGMIYLGTHARGIWKSASLLSAKPFEDFVSNADKPLELNVYPNPIQDEGQIAFELSSASDVVIEVYDLNGRLVQSMNFNNMPAGPQTVDINMGSLSAGTYLLNFQSATERRTGKLVKR